MKEIFASQVKKYIEEYNVELEEFYHLDLKKSPYTMEEVILNNIDGWFEENKNLMTKEERKAHESLSPEEKEEIIHQLLITEFYPKWNENYKEYKEYEELDEYEKIEALIEEEREYVIYLQDDEDPLNIDHPVYFPRPIRKMWKKAGWDDLYYALHYYAVKWKGGRNGNFVGWKDPKEALKWEKYYEDFVDVYGDEKAIEMMFEWYETNHAPEEALKMIKNGVKKPKNYVRGGKEK